MIKLSLNSLVYALIPFLKITGGVSPYLLNRKKSVCGKEKKKGQTQCQRLPHEWALGKGKTEAKSAEKRKQKKH